MTILIKRNISATIPPKTDTDWQLVITREGDEVLFNLYWFDKETPTHIFSCSMSQFSTFYDLLEQDYDLPEQDYPL